MREGERECVYVSEQRSPRDFCSRTRGVMAVKLADQAAGGPGANRSENDGGPQQYCMESRRAGERVWLRAGATGATLEAAMIPDEAG